MRQVGEGKARVAVGEFFVHDHRRGGIKACAARGFRNRDADEAEVPELAQQADVHLGLFVVFHRLRFDVIARELPHGLAQHCVFFTWVE